MGRPPLELWQILYKDFSIIVYPSAFHTYVDLPGLNSGTLTFTDLYEGHIR